MGFSRVLIRTRTRERNRMMKSTMYSASGTLNGGYRILFGTLSGSDWGCDSYFEAGNCDAVVWVKRA